MELKNCPCCGSPAAVTKTAGEFREGYAAACTNLKCGIATPAQFDRKAGGKMISAADVAAGVWNERKKA